MSLKPTIGIETHIELNTNTKMFCRCAVVDTDEPNISLCPTCIGLPGALPVPNKKAIEFITLLALSTGCEITSKGMFHRKNYFCLLYTSPSPRDLSTSRMPSSA